MILTALLISYEGIFHLRVNWFKYNFLNLIIYKYVFKKKMYILKDELFYCAKKKYLCNKISVLLVYFNYLLIYLSKLIYSNFIQMNKCMLKIKEI